VGSELLRRGGPSAEWQVAVTSLAHTLLMLERGEIDLAQRHADTGMAIFQRLGQPYGLGLAHNYQGDVARRRGDVSAAATHYLAALPCLREAQARSEVPAVLHNLGLVRLAQGEVEQARQLLREGFELHREIGNAMGMAECLNGLAATLVVLDQLEPAALLLGALETLCAAHHLPLFASEQAMFDQTAARVEAALGSQRWHQQRIAGRTLTRNDVTQLVGTPTAASQSGADRVSHEIGDPRTGDPR
jgi:tetratricopeptide (TPR) repeat protein